FEGLAQRSIDGLGCPYHFVPTLPAAMQVMRLVIRVERITLTFEYELGVLDAIGDPPDNRAKVRTAFGVAVEILEPEHDVRERTRPVRHVELRENGAVVRDLGYETVFVRQRVELHRYIA